MAARITFDDDVLRARMRRVVANRTDARTAALKTLAERMIVYIVRTGPRDTNRFVRAYAMAGNDLGLGPFVAPPIRPGRYQANVRRLRSQWRKWAYIVERYEAEGRTHYKGVKKTGPDRGYQKAKRLRDRAAKSLEQLLEAGEGSGAIVIGGRRGAKGLSQLASVRTKVYGGQGAWIISDGRTLARIHNLEPHASIVNRNTRVVTDAVRAARRYGGRRLSEKYVREVAQGTPWAQERAA